MKFLCSHCKAKYQIADEKVAGRTLRMTCRSCQQEIMIRGDLPAPPPPPVAVPVQTPMQSLQQAPHQAPRAAYSSSTNIPARRAPTTPSPLGADFQRQVVASVHPPPLATPIDEWHVGINDVPVGPMRREEVARKLAAGAIHPESLAWREGLDDWLPIRNIPELAVLCAPGMTVSPPPLHSPAQRTELGPIGGRAGASPAYATEDWAQVAQVASMVEPNPSQVSINPMLGAPVERRTGMPSISVIFALAAGFALLTAVVAIFGARWLQGGQQQQVVAAPVAKSAESAPVAAAPAPVAQPAGPGADQGTAEVGEMVIGLDDPGMQGDNRGGTRPRSGTTGATGGTKQSGKKELTDEQKAMLARMGGGDAPANLNLGSQPVGGAQQRAATGTLSQAEVSKVVLRGRVNLQRCYETAVRGSGSTDTVRMDVELTVTPAGNATAIKTSGQGLPGMAQCIERTVKMWRFPSSGEAAPIKFPLLFQPGA